MPGDAVPMLFALGLLASTALLHGTGYWLSRNLTSPEQRSGRSVPAANRRMERAGIGDSGT
jgi:hydrogenase/urease accessory protein HupE